MTPYPPTTPFMQLAAASREAVVSVGLNLYYLLRRRGTGMTQAQRRAHVGAISRLQLYVCGDPEYGFEDWMLGAETA